MTQAVEALPDDPETLKAMLIAERQRAERLVQIIKDLQRHRFGRRAESLPEDQFAAGARGGRAARGGGRGGGSQVGGRARGGGAQTTREPRRPAGASAAFRVARRRRGQDLPVLQGGLAPDRRGREREARRRSGAVPGARPCADPNTLAALARMSSSSRRRRRVSSRAACRPRRRWRRHWSPNTPTICRSIVRPRSMRVRACGSTVRRSQLGRTRRLPSASRPRADCRASQVVDEAVRRRDDGAGARSGAGANQDRAALGLCAGRPSLGRNRPAGGRLRLRARPQGRPANRASCGLQGRPSGRRLRRLFARSPRRAR